MIIYQVTCFEDEDYTMVFAREKDAVLYSTTLGDENSQIVPITLTGTKVEVASQAINRLDCVKQNDKAQEEAMQTLADWSK